MRAKEREGIIKREQAGFVGTRAATGSLQQTISVKCSFHFYFSPGPL